jgi:hypothetical protein
MGAYWLSSWRHRVGLVRPDHGWGQGMPISKFDVGQADATEEQKKRDEDQEGHAAAWRGAAQTHKNPNDEGDQDMRGAKARRKLRPRDS